MRKMPARAILRIGRRRIVMVRTSDGEKGAGNQNQTPSHLAPEQKTLIHARYDRLANGVVTISFFAPVDVRH
jgi:hypothetical protein